MKRKVVKMEFQLTHFKPFAGFITDSENKLLKVITNQFINLFISCQSA